MSSASKTMTLEQVWREYQHSLNAFLHSKVANEADVEDLQQEILIKTYQNLGEVHNQASVKAWLFQLANRTIIDFYRKRARARRDGKLQAEDLWFEQETRDVQQEFEQCLAPFIQALPKDSADLLNTVELEGVSQKQLAEQQNISYSTLKSRVQKGRSELRKLFEECCDLTLDKRGNVIDYQPRGQGCSGCFNK